MPRSRSKSRPSIVRNAMRRVGNTPRRSRRALEIQLYEAPVSTKRSASSARSGCSTFHSRTLTENVPITYLRNHLLHLPELQLHRSRAPENRHHDLQGLAVFVHLVHHAGKAGKRAFGDAYRLVLPELDLELGLFLAVGHPVHDLLHFFIRQWGRVRVSAHKA